MLGPPAVDVLAAAAHRPNSLEVDLDAIAHNVRLVRGLLPEGARLYGAVKANGYGFGLPEVAQSMLAAGADAFSLADPADAARIRAAGIDAPILLYGGGLPGAETERFLREHGVVPTIGSYEAAEAWSRLADGVLPAF